MKDSIKYIWDALHSTMIGMRITFAHMFMPKVTVQYPDESYPIPDNARNRLNLDYDLCTGCKMCANSCPVHCIDIETMKVGADEDAGELKNGMKRKMWALRFDIDFAKCCFCGLCAENCPTKAIKTTTFFEYSEYDRKKLVYSFSKFTKEEAEAKKIKKS